MEDSPFLSPNRDTGRTSRLENFRESWECLVQCKLLYQPLSLCVSMTTRSAAVYTERRMGEHADGQTDKNTDRMLRCDINLGGHHMMLLLRIGFF